MWRRLVPVASAALASLGFGASARAHVCMVSPVPRVGANCTSGSPQKVGPCGVNERGTNVTVYRPGETITVKLNETIDHPSHYRIAFNPSGDDFEDPTSKDDKSGNHPFVLKDGISDETLDDSYPDNPATTQDVQVTLPNALCENCTLQLIQVMYDKGGNGFGGNDGSGGKTDNDDIYYACADIALRGEPVGGGAVDAAVPAPDAGSGGDASSAGGASGGTTGATGSAGGTTGASGSAGAGGSTAGSDSMDDDFPDEGGCSCAVHETRWRLGDLAGMSVAALALLLRRRRSRG